MTASAAQNQKRFRKRGGAKKKKKEPSRKTFPSSNVPSPANTAPLPSVSYFSGFQETTSALDSDLQSYITKLSAELISLDPEEAIASSFASNPTDDPPPSVLLARNALLELSPRIYELARDSNASRLLEALIRVVADPVCVSGAVKAVVDLGASRVATLVTHRTGSFVLEKLLSVVGDSSSKEAEEAVFALAKCVTEWSKEEIIDMMQSPSGSHVFRRIVALLSGLPLDEPKNAKLDDSDGGKIVRYMYDMGREVHGEWKDAVVTVVKRLLEDGSGSISDFAWHTAPCAAVQSLLSAVVISDEECAWSLAEQCVKGKIADLMRHPCGGRLVERTILCFGAEFVEGVYKGHLKKLVMDPRANFCVQRILLGLKGRGAVMHAWDELEEVVPELMKFGKAREGVVLALLRVTEVEGDEVCRKRASRCIARACGAVGENAKNLTPILMLGSKELCKTWKDALENIGREGLGFRGGTENVLRLPGQNEGVPTLSLLGMLMARCIMRYAGGPGQSARDSVSALGETHLLALMGSWTGSRILEQWMDGESGGKSVKNVSRIINIVGKPNRVRMVLGIARNPYGAKVLLKCVARASLGQRKIVMDALASDMDNLKRLDCGQMLVRKLRVEQYMRRRDEWENKESAKETRERLFAKILADEEVEGPGAEVNLGAKEKRKRRGKEPEEDKRKRRRSDIMGGVCITERKATGDSEANEIFESLLPSGKKRDVEGEVGGSLLKGVDNDKGDKEGLDNVLGAIEKVVEPAKKKTKDKKRKRKWDDG